MVSPEDRDLYVHVDSVQEARDTLKELGFDLDKVARRTPGFTGADLQNLMNEAAILAARRGLQEISKEEIADGRHRRVTMTPVLLDLVHSTVLAPVSGDATQVH